jgi:hypothetical protein
LRLGGGEQFAQRTNCARPPERHQSLKLEGIRPCTTEELRKFSLLRAIPLKGLQLACKRRLLFSCAYPYQGLCWIITDDARRNAIARRLDGEPFRDLGSRTEEGCRTKSRSIRGSEANWPIGIAQANGFPAISLHEGAPDFLTAFWLIWAGAVENLVAPVCITGASCRIHEDALPLFRGKRVRIFGHADKAGRDAVVKWAGQLHTLAEVDEFEFSGLIKRDGSPVKDLNDFISVDYKRSGCPIEVVTGAFDFALEGLGYQDGRTA